MSRGDRIVSSRATNGDVGSLAQENRHVVRVRGQEHARRLPVPPRLGGHERVDTIVRTRGESQRAGAPRGILRGRDEGALGAREHAEDPIDLRVPSSVTRRALRQGGRRHEHEPRVLHDPSKPCPRSLRATAEGRDPPAVQDEAGRRARSRLISSPSSRPHPRARRPKILSASRATSLVTPSETGPYLSSSSSKNPKSSSLASRSFAAVSRNRDTPRGPATLRIARRVFLSNVAVTRSIE